MVALTVSLPEIIVQRISARTDRRVRGLEVEVAETGDSIILRGRTSSFHVKQLAQQGAREALPQARIENTIVVE